MIWRGEEKEEWKEQEWAAPGNPGSTLALSSVGAAEKKSKPISESKAIMSLGPLTDEKAAFRQWDLKLVNALNMYNRTYGEAIKKIKEKIDRGQGPEDIRPGFSRGRSESVSGPGLAEILNVVDVDGCPLDVLQLDADLNFILDEKTKMGSDILQRMTNVQEYEGSCMYAEVYKWFTETSGLGLAEQTARLMDSKPAAMWRRP